ncbi:MBL fold metallo-hydrolase [Streptosporangium sp. NPDC087985]|uniref:MBL fold metallo-hydrolase n=1 Tax=Streptosporangium sp. NPDC087985 TaxID=3366196 RepID=UPI003801AC6D
MTPDPLLPILRAVAEVFLSRPALAGREHEHDVDQLVTARRETLIDALTRFQKLRDRLRRDLRIPGDQPESRALATLLLSSDHDVFQAGLRLAEQLNRVNRLQQTRLRRHQKKVDDLRARLERANGRNEHAVVGLQNTRAALDDAEKRAEELDVQVSTLQRRLSDPHTTAASLLSALQQSPDIPDGDPESRDPRNRQTSAIAPPVPLVALAAKAAGIEPETLIAALQAIVSPPDIRPEPRVTVTREFHLRVLPLGGATEIGGSCVLIEVGGTRLLVDAGLRPGDPAQPPRDIDQALTGPIDAVVVTHAHTDHCGYVPALVERIPHLRVIATPATVQLMPAMWTDSAKLMGRRQRTYREWGLSGEALYQRDAVEAAVQRCEEVPYGVRRRIGDITLELFPAGHILGAAGVVIQAGDQRVVVTGDISGFRQESVDGYEIPDAAREADLLVMESTCCAEIHDARETRVNDLVRSVEDVYSAGGRVLIPAFALGRAQELALIMRSRLPHVPVLLDGMAADITSSFESITADRGSPLRIVGGNVSRANRPDDLDQFTSGVVITTSGMLTGGPAVQWAARILPEANSALFLSGYQDEESGGARLLKLAEEHASHLPIDDHGVERRIPLRARIEMMRLSAHADKRGLLEIADEVAAQQVMLVHGISSRQRDFARILEIRHHCMTPTGPWHNGQRGSPGSLLP